jgi:hypothetical protein
MGGGEDLAEVQAILPDRGKADEVPYQPIIYQTGLLAQLLD